MFFAYFDQILTFWCIFIHLDTLWDYFLPVWTHVDSFGVIWTHLDPFHKIQTPLPWHTMQNNQNCGVKHFIISWICHMQLNHNFLCTWIYVRHYVKSRLNWAEVKISFLAYNEKLMEFSFQCHLFCINRTFGYDDTVIYNSSHLCRY